MTRPPTVVGDLVAQAERIVAAWPELTDEQADRIVALLRSNSAQERAS